MAVACCPVKVRANRLLEKCGDVNWPKSKVIDSVFSNKQTNRNNKHVYNKTTGRPKARLESAQHLARRRFSKNFPRSKHMLTWVNCFLHSTFCQEQKLLRPISWTALEESKIFILTFFPHFAQICNIQLGTKAITDSCER